MAKKTSGGTFLPHLVRNEETITRKAS